MSDWNRISYFIAYVAIVFLLIKILALNDTVSKQTKEIDDLKTVHTELQLEYAHMLDEVIRLDEENGIFTSMLGEIEGEPGGSEILDKLYNQHK